MSPIDHYLLELALLLIGALVAARLAVPLHVPDVVTLLLAGMVLGTTGFGWLHLPAGLAGVQILVIVGAAYILFRGGMTLEFDVLRSVWISVVLLATVGVIVTAAVTAVPAAWLFGLSATGALLVASVVASTDPATLIPVLNHAHVRPRLTQAIVAESASNDAMGAILTFSLLAAATGGGTLTWAVIPNFLWNAGGGIGVGIVAGLAGALLMFDRHWFHGTIEIVLLSVVVLAYAVAERIGASGYMAAFVAGLVVGNRHLRFHRRQPVSPERHDRFEHFLDTLADLFRMLLFMLLGSEIDVRSVAGAIPAALLVVLVLMFVARPLTVLISTLPDRRAHWSWRELIFLAWSRETGVIPAALVGALAARNAPHLREITAVTAVAILVTVLLQGSTAGPLARLLGLTEPDGSPPARPVSPPAPTAARSGE